MVRRRRKRWESCSHVYPMPGEHLEAALRDVDARVAHPGLRHAGDLTGVVGTGLHRTGRGHRDRLGAFEVHAHVGQLVLDRLERADGPTERDPVDGVLAGHLEQHVHRPDRIRDREHECDLELVLDVVVCTPRRVPTTVASSTRTSAKVTRREPLRDVVAGETPHGEPWRRRGHQELGEAVGPVGGDEQPARPARRPAPGRLRPAGSSRRRRDRFRPRCPGSNPPVESATTQRGDRLARRRSPGSTSACCAGVPLRAQRRRHHVHGDERPRLEAATALLGDDGEVADALTGDAAAAELLGHQHREPAELGGLTEVRRRRRHRRSRRERELRSAGTPLR